MTSAVNWTALNRDTGEVVRDGLDSRIARRLMLMDPRLVIHRSPWVMYTMPGTMTIARKWVG